MERYWIYVGKADEDQCPGQKIYKCEVCGHYIYRYEHEKYLGQCPKCHSIMDSTRIKF